MTSPEHRPLRWGVVGTGAISRQMVADFALVPDATVSAVASREVERADAFADEFGIAERYASRREMFASDIDAVYIATPHVTHFEIASEAIAAGRHVLCEKPLGMNEREVRELSAQAVDAGVFLMEAMWMKFNPLYARLCRAHRRGRAGRRAQRAGRVRRRLPAATAAAGGCRAGARCSTRASTRSRWPTCFSVVPTPFTHGGQCAPDGVDLREEFSLGYADDRFAHGASSMVEWIDPSAAVSGTDAYVTITGGFWWASQLTVHHPLPWGQRRQEVIEVEREGNGYVPMLRAVVDAIRAGALEHPLHTAAATAEIYSTLDEIRRQITR